MRVQGIRSAIVVLALGCLAATCVPEAGTTPAELAEYVDNSHVVVELTRTKCTPRTGELKGSGVVIGRNGKKTYILTASHATVSKNSKKGCNYELAIRPRKGQITVLAQIEKVSNEGLDATIISARNINNRITKIARGNPRKGTLVFAFGTPGKHFRKVVRRRVYGCKGPHNCRFFYRVESITLDGYIRAGFSGGGLYNVDGKLVGMCRAAEKKTKRGVCIPIRALRSLLAPYVGER